MVCRWFFTHQTSEEMASGGGFSGIISQDITDSFGLAFRAEYFDDTDGARLGVARLDLWEVTLTANIKIRENLLVRPEIRYDDADDEEIFDRVIINSQRLLVLPICSKQITVVV